MRQLRVWLLRLSGLFRKDQPDAEFSSELESHLHMHIQDNLRAGMSAEEARRQALIKLGGVEQTKEMVRERRGLPMLEVVLQDLRFGVRMLSKNPGFTAVATLTLALGIAANATIFSFVSAVMFRRPPVGDPDRVVVILSINPVNSCGINMNPFSDSNYFAWKKQNRMFVDMAAADPYAGASLTGDGTPERVAVMRTTANYFSVLGVSPQIGRTFAEGEDQNGREHVVVLSPEFWARRFAADPNEIGKTIRLNGTGYEVIGVMPAKFVLQSFQAQIWMPVVLEEGLQSAAARENRNLFLFARLKPDVAVSGANAEFQRLARLAEQNFPDTEKGWGATVLTLQQHMIRVFNAGPALALLMGAVGFVLLIACANIAGLLLARATGRGKEIAVRVAMGAGRFRMIRQLLTEALLLAALGGAAGLALTFWGARLLKSALSFNGEVTALDLSVDGKVLAFTAGISLLAAVVFGLAPALKAGTSEVYTILKNATGKASAGSRQNRLRSVVVIGEVALAVVLLTGTGLMIKGVVDGMRKGLGFAQDHVLTAFVSLPDSHYSDAGKQAAFYQELLKKMEHMLGAESAAIASTLPAGGADQISFRLKGQENLPPGERFKARYFVVSPKFFETAKIRLIRGRAFSETDGPDSNGVAVVSEVFARQFYPKRDAIGQQVLIDTAGEGGTHWREIIGIVANVKGWPLEAADDPEIYENFLQRPAPEMALMRRTRGNPDALAPGLREAVWGMDKDQPIASVMSLEERIGNQIAGDRLFVQMLGIFAALALTLSGVGLYGLVAYTVGLRTQEIGIRMALGANRKKILKQVVGEGMKLAVTGAAIGMALAVPLPRVLEGLLQDFRPPIRSYAGVAALLSWPGSMPARRAARVDPMAALRYE